MKVHGVVVIDLTRLHLDSRDAASTAKAALWGVLADTPPGADVRLIVRAWDWWCRFAIDTLLDLGDHLASVTVESDAVTVRRWVLALRQGARSIGLGADR